MKENSTKKLSQEILSRFTEKGLTLSTAESCTGGLLAKYLTDIPGSSEYFRGGIVAYSNNAKVKLLAVREKTLETFGTVSAECAAEMSHGCEKVFQTDASISITGIAGPGGGSKEKPVGLVFTHIRLRGEDVAFRYNFTGDRVRVRECAAEAVFRSLLSMLER